MTYQAQAVDTTEPFSDDDWEIVANLGNYHVLHGAVLIGSA